MSVVTVELAGGTQVFDAREMTAPEPAFGSLVMVAPGVFFNPGEVVSVVYEAEARRPDEQAGSPFSEQPALSVGRAEAAGRLE